MRLQRADLESVLAFLSDIDEFDVDEAYSAPLLARLQRLIRCGEIGYQEYEYEARRSCLVLSVSAGVATRWEMTDEGSEAPEEDAIYWRVGPCPIVSYRMRARDLGAVRMSDLIAGRRFRELPVYREYFRRSGFDHMLDIGLAERDSRQRSLILFRGSADGDFSERDRAMLELLRPHFRRLETHVALRRRLAAALREQEADARLGSVVEGLTPREREIVALVAQGKTNAEIASGLWVAPATVKKHLEHVYAKLGVGRRAAVAGMRHEARV